MAWCIEAQKQGISYSASYKDHPKLWDGPEQQQPESDAGFGIDDTPKFLRKFSSLRSVVVSQNHKDWALPRHLTGLSAQGS
jgi:hypothetical protein